MWNQIGWRATPLFLSLWTIALWVAKYWRGKAFAVLNFSSPKMSYCCNTVTVPRTDSVFSAWLIRTGWQTSEFLWRAQNSLFKPVLHQCPCTSSRAHSILVSCGNKSCLVWSFPCAGRNEASCFSLVCTLVATTLLPTSRGRGVVRVKGRLFTFSLVLVQFSRS